MPSVRLSAVRDREGIVDEDVAEPGQFGDEVRIVLLFAWWKRVFPDRTSPPALGDRLRGGLADAIVGESNGLA